MRKVLLFALCALFALPVMAQRVDPYQDYLRNSYRNESYSQYLHRRKMQQRSHVVGEIFGTIKDIIDKDKPVEKKPNHKVKVYSVVTPEIVDLGLPSGIQWASMNLGAKVPEEVGNFYASDEITPKTEFSQENRARLEDCTVLERDAAHQSLGGYWRLPDRQEYWELYDECMRENVTVNGIPCRKYTGPNGNSIIIPLSPIIYESGVYYIADSVAVQFSNRSGMDGQGVVVRPVYEDPKFIQESKLKAIEQKRLDEVFEQGVDLGIGTIWAKFNYGTSTPEATGSYATELFDDGSDFPLSRYSYRLPTEDELKSLSVLCTWTEMTIDGVNGYKVTGPNGNSIFIPCAGYEDRGATKDKNKACYLLTSTRGVWGPRGLQVKDGKHKWKYATNCKYTIRPVISK